jgi:plasmid stabilization system protein ParE
MLLAESGGNHAKKTPPESHAGGPVGENGAGLLETLDALAEYPLMGSDQGHIRPALRRHVYKSHTIYYRPERNAVVVQRIPGPGQDPLREL